MNPERGRKLKTACTLKIEYVAFQNVNPERGRKPALSCSSVSAILFQNVNPERGRKLLDKKGDKPEQIISEREPRKGTETFLLSHLHSLLHRVISEREPRKGTETHNKARISEREPRFQNVNPERGRKQ